MLGLGINLCGHWQRPTSQGRLGDAGGPGGDEGQMQIVPKGHAALCGFRSCSLSHKLASFQGELCFCPGTFFCREVVKEYQRVSLCP